MPTPVQVTFNPNTQTWTFDPKTAHMNQAGIVLLQREPQTASWTFVSANGLPAGYTYSVQANGAQLAINDPHGPPFNVDITYTVTVQANGTNYTCAAMAGKTAEVGGPPPIIMNDGTGAGGKR